MQLSSIHEALQNVIGLDHDLGKPLQRTSAAEFRGIVDDHLDAKYALAFGINLQSQLATLEDRQIIRRFLELLGRCVTSASPADGLGEVFTLDYGFPQVSLARCGRSWTQSACLTPTG